MPFVLSESSLPSAPIESVLVVGAGLAGLRTVQALRQRGFTGEITIVGDEPHAPYDRPPLSKHLFDHDQPVFFADDIQADVSELASEFVPGMRVVSLAQGARGWTATAVPSEFSDDSADSQRHLTADAVVLAVGSAPVAVDGWTGVSRLYTWEDAVRLREALKSPGTIVIIGAGWIGAELSALAAGQGHEVHVVEAFPTPLFRQLGSIVGARVAQWFDQEGISLHANSRVTSVLASSAGFQVAFATQEAKHTTINADVVVSSIGARPQTAWLKGTVPLTDLGAVVTDQFGRVQDGLDGGSVSGLFAVGDCAVRRDDIHQWIPGGHWNTALSDPERIAASICAESPDTGISTPTPHVFSTQFGRELNLFGTPDVDADSVRFRAHPDGGFTALYLREVREDARTAEALLTGVFTVDAPRDAAAARKLLAAGPTMIDLDRAVNAGVMLRSVKL